MANKKEDLTLVEVKGLYDSSEKLVKEIRMISRAFKKMASGGLKRETIVLLIHNTSNVGKPDVRAVLSPIEGLEREYTNPEKDENK